MSLSIYVDAIDPETKECKIIDSPTGYHLMGNEGFRTMLWGSQVMYDLGLTLLPSLGAGAYLILESPEEIDLLESEVLTIQNNLQKIGEAVGEDMVYNLEQTYLRNLHYAIEVARRLKGCITIG